ncbi:D-sedoheptulose-7-phosphate isomerase [Rufibacter latericius]|uniref:Phosphoheptose isomerase n=1 Tax=Rufibacter latericius TaxID=2487040 RepID=A0A3M9MWF2_9BACT|nr:D-sedoheptulose 7-phosphate isomerase [Rufibacter latericius]RNI29223.1 SIS domain-containing protein [Rufibacter latericius]
MLNFISSKIQESIDVKTKLLQDQQLLETLEKVSDLISSAFKADKKVFFCGNGGSAADAQHLAAEFSGRFYIDRAPLFAEALHVNTSYLTAVANDYSYDEVYSRLIKAKGRKGDVLIGISTSGNSKNIINAFREAKKNEVLTIALTGESGGAMREEVDYLLNVPSNDTPRIQESHILLGHIICEIVEKELFVNKND